MKITIDIDDQDRFEDDARDTPWTLNLTTDTSEGESIPIGSELALIGADIPAMLRELADKWPAYTGHDPQLATVDLTIHNTYAESGTITTTLPAVIVPVPESLEREKLDEWAADHLMGLTGAGITDEDAYYEVHVTKSSYPELENQIFEFDG